MAERMNFSQPCFARTLFDSRIQRPVRESGDGDEDARGQGRDDGPGSTFCAH
jgi:hypothetical protein